MDDNWGRFTFETEHIDERNGYYLPRGGGGGNPWATIAMVAVGFAFAVIVMFILLLTAANARGASRNEGRINRTDPVCTPSRTKLLVSTVPEKL